MSIPASFHHSQYTSARPSVSRSGRRAQHQPKRVAVSWLRPLPRNAIQPSRSRTTPHTETWPMIWGTTWRPCTRRWARAARWPASGIAPRSSALSGDGVQVSEDPGEPTTRYNLMCSTYDMNRCPLCGDGPMRVIAVLTPPRRSPPHDQQRRPPVRVPSPVTARDRFAVSRHAGGVLRAA